MGNLWFPMISYGPKIFASTFFAPIVSNVHLNRITLQLCGSNFQLCGCSKLEHSRHRFGNRRRQFQNRKYGISLDLWNLKISRSWTSKTHATGRIEWILLRHPRTIHTSIALLGLCRGYGKIWQKHGAYKTMFTSKLKNGIDKKLRRNI